MTHSRKRRDKPTEEARLAALAELLARPGASWAEVLTLLARWPAEQRPERALALVEAVADRWSPRVRGLARTVVRELERGEVRPHLRLLRSLDLRELWRVPRRDQLFERMIAEGGVRELHALTTRYEPHGEQLIAQLVRHVGGLRHLYLGSSAIGSAGARALAEAPALAGLGHLSLHNNAIDDAGAEALLGSPHLAGLRFLNLYCNDLTPRMVERVVAAPQWRQATIVIHGQGGRTWLRR